MYGINMLLPLVYLFPQISDYVFNKVYSRKFWSTIRISELDMLVCRWVCHGKVGKSRCNKEFNRKRATVTVVIIGHQPKQYTIKGKSQFTIHLHQVWFSQKIVPFRELPVSKPFQQIIQLLGGSLFLLHIYRASPFKPTEQSNLQNDFVPFDLF